MGRWAVLRVGTRDVRSAENSVVGERRRVGCRGVVPDAGTAESSAMFDRKRIHTIGRDKRRGEPCSCL